MDITDTLAPTSDQLDAVDLVGGPRIMTVASVSRGSADQPVQVHLHEYPRPWRPSKGMRRILAAGWGPDASQWAGHRVELYCDPTVQYGGQAVGGIRIKAMSHLPGPLRVPVLIKRGRTQVVTIEPLPDAPAPTQQADPLAQAKAGLWQAWQATGRGDAAALAQAYLEATGQALTDATAADLEAYRATIAGQQAGEEAS